MKIANEIWNFIQNEILDMKWLKNNIVQASTSKVISYGKVLRVSEFAIIFEKSGGNV
jgi:hypothetical protein